MLLHLYVYWPWLVALAAALAIGYVSIRLSRKSTHTIDSWDSFWKVYDELIDKMRSSQKASVADELAAAKGVVNGLTDGWYDLKSELERLLKSYKGELDEEESKSMRLLLAALKRALSNRWR